MYRTIVLLAAMAVLSPLVSAKVNSVAKDQFVLSYSYDLPVTPTKAYAQFVAIPHWWSPDHTFSGDAKNLRIKVEPNGGMYERSSSGLMVEHMRLVYAQPHRMLRFKGGLGPLQGEPVQGTMTVKFVEQPEGTQLQVQYQVYGSQQFNYEQWAPIVDQVLTAQWLRYQGVLTNTDR